MTPLLQRAVLVGCLAVLLGARVPAPQTWQGALAVALAALLGAATLTPPASATARRLRPAILPAAVALAILPDTPAAALSFVPWPVTAALLVVFLHLAFPAAAAVGSRAGVSVARWGLVLALLALAALAPLLLPFAMPPPLAALHELRPIGGVLITALAITVSVGAAALVLRARRPTGPDVAGEGSP